MADFATLNDLSIRLGRVSSSDLTTAQTAQGNLLLALASGLIREAADRDADWDPSPVPVILRAVCLEVCARVMTNPAGVRTENETLGAHTHAVSYPEGTSGLYLTEREARLVRGEVLSATSGSAATESLATTIAENMPNTLNGLLEESSDDVPIYDWAN